MEDRNLGNIVLEMRALVLAGDRERAHGNADDLLQELVLWLARRDPDGDVFKSVQAILEYYRAVPKWYA